MDWPYRICKKYHYWKIAPRNGEMTARLVSWRAVGGRGRSRVPSERLPEALRSAVTYVLSAQDRNEEAVHEPFSEGVPSEWP